MELIQGSETSANYNLTPGKYPEENIQYSNHSESLKSRMYLVIYFCLFTNHLLFDTKKKGYCIKSKPNQSYSHNKITGTHHALVRDCFSPSTASVRYRLPAVISFKFTSLYHPSYLSLTVPKHTLPA